MTDKAARNPEYPPDFQQYLDETYDEHLGKPRKSYEDWKAQKGDVGKTNEPH
jgi:hypothetical protein